jgi:hypothetical protein
MKHFISNKDYAAGKCDCTICGTGVSMYVSPAGKTRCLTAKRIQDKKIIRCWDGEGESRPSYTLDDGTVVTPQDYKLLSYGDENGNTDRIARSDRALTSQECLAFITEQPNKKYLNIAFGFGYDKTMILKDMPDEGLEFLFHREKRAYVNYKGKKRYYNLNWDGYELDTYGSLTKVRPSGTKQKFVSIWDIAPMIQSSALKFFGAWMPELTDSEKTTLAEGKARRGDTFNLSDEIVYNRTENLVTAKAFRKIVDKLEALNVKPRSWHGASVCKAIAKKEGLAAHLPDRTTTTDIYGNKSWVYPEEDLINGVLDSKAYVGGRFEISAHGPVHEKVYEYDISSAYAGWLLQLPSLKEATYDRKRFRTNDKYLEDSDFFLAQVSWDFPDDSIPWGPFPYSDCGISFPLWEEKRWIWSPEVRVALSIPELAPYIKIHQAIYIRPATTEKPFAYLADWYDHRLDWEAENPGMGKCLKTWLAATYGICAQTKGASCPKFQCLTWAGMVTSGVRSQILLSIYTGTPTATIAIATDAIFTLEPRPDLLHDKTPHKTVIGSWGETVHPEGFFQAQAGYRVGYGEKADASTKSRGTKKQAAIDALPGFETAWDESNVDAYGIVMAERFIGGLGGCRRPELRGCWIRTPLKLKFAVESKDFTVDKRQHPYMLDGIMRSWPIVTPKGLELQDMWDILYEVKVDSDDWDG